MGGQVASALAIAGNSLDQSIAMFTAMTEINQDDSETGNAAKLYAMRLRGAKVELEAMGESTDGMAVSTSKLREKVLALTKLDNITGYYKNQLDRLDATLDKGSAERAKSRHRQRGNQGRLRNLFG
ncbi:MAG: hypothetical protein RSE58_14125, partial [Clostridia bacterium]